MDSVEDLCSVVRIARFDSLRLARSRRDVVLQDASLPAFADHHTLHGGISAVVNDDLAMRLPCRWLGLGLGPTMKRAWMDVFAARDQRRLGCNAARKRKGGGLPQAACHVSDRSVHEARKRANAFYLSIHRRALRGVYTEKISAL